eukprot:CAMPEP_0184859998 /NCGR_PEP_ID=MMETSP0580-20130426/4959_1 /TAXON_ID=1118495 /ORGANISM="Dactyliosolen fragilissimus" /LENGTH=264 /DNA_ID=CAMNT_0027356925 /DNA_START=163 /DNA_END=957 /DNA_ORIENTATION=-
MKATSFQNEGFGLNDLSATNSPASSGNSTTSKNVSKSGAQSGNENVILWRERITTSIARSRKIRGGNFVQIATVDPVTSGARCRTVVFRGFQSLTPHENPEKACTLKMITDSRSDKVSEAETGAEIVWWFSKSNEQYRLRGSLNFVGPNGLLIASRENENSSQTSLDDQAENFLIAARKQQWGNLSDLAREQFYWKNPGTVHETQNDVPPGGRDEDGKVLPPPENFLLMLLSTTHVDYLRLGDNFRQIDEFHDEEIWVSKRVNP